MFLDHWRTEKSPRPYLRELLDELGIRGYRREKLMEAPEHYQRKWIGPLGRHRLNGTDPYDYIDTIINDFL